MPRWCPSFHLVLAALAWLGAALAPLPARAVEDKVAFLTEKLRGSDSFKVRLKAAIMLGRMDDPRAVGPLTSALQDDNYVVRGAAARALGNLGHPMAVSSVETLFELIGDEEQFVQNEARRALGRLAGQRSLDQFIAALSSGKPDVRLTAVSVLAKLDLPEARAGVVRALGDEDEEVRTAAILAVQGLPAEVRDQMLMEALADNSRYQVQATAVRLVGELKLDNVLEKLAGLLVSDEVVPEVKREAQEAVLVMKERIDVGAFMAALRAGDKDRQRLAIKMLGLQGGRQAVDALLSLLADPDVFVRRRVVFALGDAGDPRAIPPLEFMLKSEESSRFRKEIERTLRKLKP
ncbi:MAG: HEAT repeat domain-containing protein [Deltaproteobacteria bacterium]|nr:HEAT repeat domain-containing protein [Deltaproteobacteria bacterium]